MNKISKQNDRIKEIRGITLIALVITIIVLLILAGVSISTLTGDNGILTQAQSASDKTVEGQIEEEVKTWLMEKTIYDTTGEGSPMTEVEFISYLEDNNLLDDAIYEEGRIITDTVVFNLKNGDKNKISTIVGEIQTEDVMYMDVNENLAIVPKGFMVSTVLTEQNIETGLVIIDENSNEFVWVPVEDTSTMYRGNSTDGYTGILYAANTYVKNEDGTVTATETTSYTEPTKQSSYPTTEESEYKEEFAAMVESVEENRGFYIGRYEMGIDYSSNATSIKKSTVYTASDSSGWNGLYTKAKTYTNGTITSQMIWGCQYDQMMIWMMENGINVNSSSAGTKNTSTTTTGTEEGDKLNNVYDLLGRGYEWIQSAYSSSGRVKRGGNYDSSYSPSDTSYHDASYTSSDRSSRFTLIL